MQGIVNLQSCVSATLPPYQLPSLSLQINLAPCSQQILETLAMVLTQPFLATIAEEKHSLQIKKRVRIEDMNKLCRESRIFSFFFLCNISFLLLYSREDSRSGTTGIVLEDIISKLLYFTEAPLIQTSIIIIGLWSIFLIRLWIS